LPFKSNLLDTEGIPGINQETLSTSLQFRDDILVKLNETWINNSFENLDFTDQISLLLNNQTISNYEPENKTVSFVENLAIQDTIQTFLPNNSTRFSEGLKFTDDVLLKINGTFLLDLPENLLLTEQDTIFLNNETVIFDIQNTSSNLIHSQIEIGKPVFWTQTVMLNDTEDIQNILLEIPADAKNITVTKIDDNSTEIIPNNSTEILQPELEEAENGYDIPRIKEMSLNEIAQKHNVKTYCSS